jgi:hypothetical protein
VCAALFATALLAACGGGSTAFAPVTAPATRAVTIPAAGGYSGSLVLTPATALGSASIDVTSATSAPSGIPAPANGDIPLLFVELLLSSTVMFAGTPAFTFTVPADALQSLRRAPQAGSATLVLTMYDPGDAVAGYQFAAPCSLTANTATCASGTVPFTAVAGTQYVFELARAAAAGASPSASPSPAPSAQSTAGNGAFSIVVPTPAPIVCAPSPVVVFLGYTADVDCTEPDYGGPLITTIAAPSIASVRQADPQSFSFLSVTGLAIGSTTLSLQSLSGGTGTVTITVIH